MFANYTAFGNRKDRRNANRRYFQFGLRLFFQLEKTAFEEIGFKAKPKSVLFPGTKGDFNGCTIEILNAKCIIITQKGQKNRLDFLNVYSKSAQLQYAF